MKSILTLLITIVSSLPAFAGSKIVNAHLSKQSIAVQIQNTETGATKWISSGSLGVVAPELGCDGVTCFATNLKNQNGALYGDVVFRGETKPSYEDVALTNFYEDTLIDISVLKLIEVNGKYIIALTVLN
ncbi:hypothetical protein DOM22_07125 [Bdellovibrio sp. ZAP7]|uniref:hypothetical protein n=1 Tax=Bdellovibrio sp. ZAP7 TaxID=2231053 RepID=UPI00115AFDBD|nr:hypothetical protein [Bdellovibrio sp. ZAP7]QDK44950.1 hypothetical protein DOM22_07125 [Bdellovibrio sp. ZAP7]